MLREDLPQGFAVHETGTVSTSFPSMPCFNNLVIFDQLKRTESVDTLVGELAEKWSWQDNYRNLVFFLRKDVKWHDGKPFTSKDVKFTFDMLREAPEAQAKLRINPRKDWYSNVEAIEAPGPLHGGLPSQAPPALAPDDVRLRLHAHLRRPRAARQLPHGLHRHRALQGQGVAQGRVRGLRQEHRTTSSRAGRTSTVSATSSSRTAARACRRSRPASSTCRSPAR